MPITNYDHEEQTLDTFRADEAFRDRLLQEAREGDIKLIALNLSGFLDTLSVPLKLMGAIPMADGAEVLSISARRFETAAEVCQAFANRCAAEADRELAGAEAGTE